MHKDSLISELLPVIVITGLLLVRISLTVAYSHTVVVLSGVRTEAESGDTVKH